MSGTRFRAPRARGAREAGFFFMDRFLLSRRFQRGITRPWEGSGSVFCSPGREAGKQTDRENRHYQNIYIDNSLKSIFYKYILEKPNVEV